MFPEGLFAYVLTFILFFLKAAKPAPTWQGVFNAYNEHIRCTQRFSGTNVVGREDCLILNVYTPLPTYPHPLPVMVFIHGGGFRDGSVSPLIYGPDYLIRHGVILVTLNYRLEVLGFLCLGTKEAPGNAGLKDQVAALRWVKENIKAFGGDPDNITIFGESAGSASVGYHLVSPMSKGLFQRAIMQSGSAISPWSMNFEPLKTAKLLAQQLGHRTEDPDEIYKIFKSITADELMKARVPRTEGDIVISENIFVPCVEKDLPDVESFLIDTPYNLITKGDYNKVPIIIGYNSAEGLMFAGKENHTMIPKLDFLKALPRDLTISSKEEKKRISDTLRRYYMGDKIISKATLSDFARFEGDSSITYPVIFTTDLLLRNIRNPVYIYKMKYDGWMNLAKIVYGFRKEPGATHADELFYMFKVRTTLPMSFFENDFIERITELWTNFAKYG